MPQVTVSSKYQVVIPQEARTRLNIRAGQKMTVIILDDIIELVPDRDLSELKGAFPTLTTEDLREETDRL